MDNKVDRVNQGTYSTAALLILFLTTMTVMVKQSEAIPHNCKPCGAANQAKEAQVKAECKECGSMYGAGYEHCCLCNKNIYNKCKEALGH